MELLKINDRIFCFPHGEAPLSADVGIIQCDDGELWVFDVGCSEDAAGAVNLLSGRKNVVLSHFHTDHTGNVGRVKYDTLYAGAFTCKRLCLGTPVTEHMYFENGIHIFPLPSSHAKGCVGLEYGNYAFLGDAVYSMSKDGRTAYNAGVLQEMINVLRYLKASWFLISHKEPFACPKDEVLLRLEDILTLRSPHDPYIFLP